MKKLIFLFLLLLILTDSTLSSQDSILILPKADSIFCLGYSFNPNDTLVYLVHSYDSIVIDYGEPLLKIRNEIVLVVCDSVSKHNTFFLRYGLLNFRGTDIQSGKKVEYTESDWIGRTIWLEIDSLGNRKSFRLDDSSISGRTPGGPFQPHLFFSLGTGCHKKGETWLVRSMDDLPENGVPVPGLRHTMLYKMYGELDTLNEIVERAEFIRTGQGAIKMMNEEGTMQVSCVINSYGVVDISKEKKIPVHLFTTVEQKLTIRTDEDSKVGAHYIHTNYTLVDYKKGRTKVLTAPKRRRK